jgi:hypothetical protein
MTHYWRNLTLDDLPMEMWRDVKGYEGIYMVSNLGRVKSLPSMSERQYKNRKTNFIPKKCRVLRINNLQTGGYCAVKLTTKGKVINFKVHRLVADAFILNKECKDQVNHINGIKTDNYVSNLEWVTQSENIKHSFSIGSHKPKEQWLAKGELNPKSKKVIQFTKNGEFVAEYGSQQEAARVTGIDQSMIWHCCNGIKCKTAGGFKWEYAEGYGRGRKGAEKHQTDFITKS